LCFCYCSRYWWQQGIHLGQLPVISWRYGLKELGVRLLWLTEKRPKHHQVDYWISNEISLFFSFYQSLKDYLV
jgi:hypothetical protein